MAIEQALSRFVVWWRENIKGDEKGEAQIFLDSLMKAFGHAGALEAGKLEERIPRKRNGKSSVSFADYVMPKCLFEMKKRGEDLKKHYVQLEEYWKSLPDRPRYAILCNFDEIWIYDFYIQFYDPVDKIEINQLAERQPALEFLIPGSRRTPVFQNNQVEVTKDAAFQLAKLFHSLADEVGRGIAQRFTLQSMIAMFAEDVGLLPNATLPRIIEACKEKASLTDNPHDLMGLLFTMMNYPKHKRRSGRFYDVDYFNGGIFDQIHLISLSSSQIQMLEIASSQDWSKIRPSIFGTMFEDSMDRKERHKIGAHFTSELDIKRIVDPVIVEPWRNVIEDVNVLPDAYRLYDELCDYIVLDPACGSGNFLYIAYREMKALEAQLRERIVELGGDITALARRVTAQQFYGYDINGFAVELAKVSLMIAKKLAVDEFESDEQPLPLDDLDDKIKSEDALLNEWVEFDACIGNPPYLGANETRRARGIAYMSDVQARFSDVPRRADYCVYWFRKAHDSMKNGARAGLVGTNTIRQNYSRIGSLDYIVDNGGVIYDAVSSMPWSGEANVHVAIANWAKGESPIKSNRLHFFAGENEAKEYVFRTVEKDRINSALSEQIDVSGAVKLTVNTKPKRVFQGIIPGHNGFIVSISEAKDLAKRGQRSSQVLKPYLIGNDLLGKPMGQPGRYVIDFNPYDIIEIRDFPALYKIISETVLPERKAKAKEEIRKNDEALAENPDSRISSYQQGLLENWWQHTGKQTALIKYLKKIDRYIGCSRVTKRPIFDFISNDIRPDSAIQVFAFDDDYTFGILQSNAHWQWFVEKASTLKSDWRYTPHSVFDTFPFPQQPAPEQVKAVAGAGRALHESRRKRMANSDISTLRNMYRTLEQPGTNRLRALHETLDKAVLSAYGFRANDDLLAQLLALNDEVAAKIEAGEEVTAPGIPAGYPNPDELVSAGCIQAPELF